MSNAKSRGHALGGVFCNRTLNMRGVAAIGYDMDYTLVVYDAGKWEEHSFDHLRGRLAEQGWPVSDLAFDPHLVIRGLVIDRSLGNVVKANRFGYVKQAAHGTAMLDFEETRRTYSRAVVDLAEDRWVFMNTLFSLSEAAMYSCLVDRLDARRLPQVMGYADLYDQVSQTLDRAHLEGHLKAEIIADPGRYVTLDPGAALALLDQRAAGKRLILVTNSDWEYTRAMMAYAFDRHLPRGETWRDLFELVMVSARKPLFFDTPAPVFRVEDDSGCLRPSPAGITTPGVYLGGDAFMVEQYMALESSDFLYVGDHIFSDVHVSKQTRRWRTALVLGELRGEMEAIEAFEVKEADLVRLMTRKSALERRYTRARLAQLRRRHHYAEPPAHGGSRGELGRLRQELEAIDTRIGPLAQASSELGNRRWGPLMRTGNDKSMLARQMENYADIYCAGVSDFVDATPFAYFRSVRGSLPHDRGSGALPMEEPD
jgi:5'-nucleotidase